MPTEDETGIRNKNQVSSSKNEKNVISPLKRRVTLGKKTNALQRSKTKGGSNIAGERRDSEMEDSANEEERD